MDNGKGISDQAGQSDLESYLATRPPARRDLLALACCSGLLFIDGFDLFVIGKIAPAVSESFGRPSADMSLVFGLQQTGLALGAFLIAPLADRLGRRSVMILCTIMISLTSMACLFAGTLEAFAIIRAFGALFMAALVPTTMAYVSELFIGPRRGRFLSVVQAGLALGSIASGGVAAWLLPTQGWQIAFYIAALAAAVMLVPLLLVVRDPILYLASRNPAHPRIAQQLAARDASLDSGAITRLQRPKSPTSSGSNGAKALFALIRRDPSSTIIAFVAMFLTQGFIASAAVWLPTFFVEMAGVPIADYAKVALLAVIGGLSGTFVAGAAVDRVGAKVTMLLTFATLPVMYVLLGAVPFSSPLFPVVMIVWTFVQAAAGFALNLFVLKLYPSDLRARGYGWASGAGRIGGILLPIIAGLALSYRLSLLQTCIAFAAGPALVLSLLVLWSVRSSCRQASAVSRASF